MHNIASGISPKQGPNRSGFRDHGKYRKLLSTSDDIRNFLLLVDSYDSPSCCLYTRSWEPPCPAWSWPPAPSLQAGPSARGLTCSQQPALHHGTQSAEWTTPALSLHCPWHSLSAVLHTVATLRALCKHLESRKRFNPALSNSQAVVWDWRGSFSGENFVRLLDRWAAPAGGICGDVGPVKPSEAPRPRGRHPLYTGASRNRSENGRQLEIYWLFGQVRL